MRWLKEAVVDVAVTVLIVTATVLDAGWAKWLIVIYTPIMLLIKGLALLGGPLLKKVKRPSAQPPAWFFHLLYAVNLTALLAAHWGWLALGWLLIWLLSAADLQPSGPASRKA